MEKLTIRLLHLLLFANLCVITLPAEDSGQPKAHKVALVLSGGGARGASHIGVLRVLEQAKIPIDCIAGTSFGALAGGLYALGYSADYIEQMLSGQDWNNIFSDAPDRRLTPLIERRNSRYQAQISFRGLKPELPTGLRGGQRLTENLDVLTTGAMLQAGYDFDRLPIQFRAVATNLVDGSTYIFRQGSMSEALRASMAIPLLFTPVEKDGMLLVDGGLADNLPTDIARDLGADIIIAVDTTSPLLKKEQIHNFLNVVDQSISLQMERNVRENRKLASIVLQPRLEEFSYDSYDRIPDIVKRGEEEANRVLDRIKALVADVPPRTPQTPVMVAPQVIESISFQGLSRVSSAQLAGNIHVHPGDVVDSHEIRADVRRLFATRLFESVGYTLEPLSGNHHRLIYVVKESPLNAVGLGIRYDNDYNFVVMAEFTARQLFRSPSTAIISSQFGGLENHFAALRFIPNPAPFVFLEPRGEVLRLERLDIRNQTLVDTYTEKTEGGRLMIGGTIFKQLEIAGGFYGERVTIDGGAPPNTLNGPQILAGPSFRLTRDTLDFRDFPRSGMTLRVQIDKRSKNLGSDLNYSKWEADYQRYFSSGRSTARIHSSIGYSRGPVPFYDLYFIGGYSFYPVASRPFVGFERDEITANQMAILGGSYRRQILTRSLSFIRRAYVTGIYNGAFVSNQQAPPYHFDFLNGVGLGLAADTILGPVRATVGWGEGGRFHFYFSFGPSF